MAVLMKIDRDEDLAPTAATLVGMTALELATLWGAIRIALFKETDPLEIERLFRGLVAIRQAIEWRSPAGASPLKAETSSRFGRC